MRKKKIGIHYYADNNNFLKHNNILSEDKFNKIIVGDSENILKIFKLIFIDSNFNKYIKFLNNYTIENLKIKCIL